MTHNDTAVRLSLNIDISFTSSVLYIIVVSFKLICLFYISCISVIKAKCNRARSLGPWSLGPRSSGHGSSVYSIDVFPMYTGGQC